MSIYSKKMSAIQSDQKLPYFAPGEYLVKIEKVKYLEPRSGPTFVIEGEVLAVKSDSEEYPDVGSSAADVWVMDSPNKVDMGLKKWKGFLEAAFDFADNGLDAATMGDEDWEGISDLVVSDTQPFTGMVMRLSAWNIKTKDTGRDFTVRRWVRQATKDDYANFGI